METCHFITLKQQIETANILCLLFQQVEKTKPISTLKIIDFCLNSETNNQSGDDDDFLLNDHEEEDLEYKITSTKKEMRFKPKAESGTVCNRHRRQKQRCPVFCPDRKIRKPLKYKHGRPPKHLKSFFCN